MIFLDNCTQEYKATKKQIVRLNEKKSKENQARLCNDLIMKMKVDLKERPYNI